MMRTPLLLATLWLAQVPAAAGAAEPAGSATPDEPQGAEQDPSPAPDTAEPAAQDPAKDPEGPHTREEGGVEVFVPSEEISEDFAVSFPVDI